MDTVFIVIALVFVVAVLALVAFALFELSPFGRHKDRYRDPITHERRFESPNLEDGHY
jgi:hypothetical protein